MTGIEVGAKPVWSTTKRTPMCRASAERDRCGKDVEQVGLVIEAGRLEPGIAVDARVTVVECQEFARGLDEGPRGAALLGLDRELEYDAVRGGGEYLFDSTVVAHRRDANEVHRHERLGDHA